MMNRREFVRAAAGTAMFARFTGALPPAASYDLIIRGGRVIDSSLRLDGVRDIAVASGRIAAIEPDKNVRIGRQRLFPSGTVLGGKRIPRA
jgi:hypothetical protein